MKDKKFERIIQRLAKISFTGDKLNQSKVKEIVNTLKTLSKGNAIKGLSFYLNLLKKRLDQNRLIIEAPFKLPDESIDKIVKIVERTHPVFETEVIINPALLGGFRIKIGDEVYEDSIEDKITQVKKAING